VQFAPFSAGLPSCALGLASADQYALITYMFPYLILTEAKNVRMPS